MFNSKQPKKKVSIIRRNLKKRQKIDYRLRVVAQFKSIASNFYNII